MATQITEGVVLQSPFIASLAKVLLVGGLMAGGAAGIYVLAETRGDGDTERLQVLGAEPADTTTLVAETATPEETPTPTVVAEPTASPTFWATPSSPNAPMELAGQAWINARPAQTAVVAYVGELACGVGQLTHLNGDYAAFYYLTVPSANEVVGCGAPGVPVRLTVDGVDAITLPWAPGPQPALSLKVGPRFASYHGYLNLAGTPWSYRVEPRVGGAVCGLQIDRDVARGGSYPFFVLVDPAEVTEGCGADGVRIDFWLILQEEENGEPISILIQSAEWSLDGTTEVGTLTPATVHTMEPTQ